MKKIKIDTEYIKLDQLLKYGEIAQTGGHAKFLIKDGHIKVNKEICTQRGKKIFRGDIVEIEGEESLIIE
ncbi:RNA-binding S4 domain-containing protein [Clostridium sp. D2Q-14]|uniref:RNA-binding S4 domain-containing protein n=1 Tax=Anaeromonas gelatinilytica TaxID=2683194 RepID=UPI00193BDC3A|nr:RNA-binding S4 domain-containing protein [Anaeromonas gelatinilytica]MBS4534944.1 RNA-binding S4 domain-containing protein [Anaeromonas gelatinilytica]